MIASELRIGNYVQCDGKIYTIGETDFVDVFYYEPIPITEDWLVKFGFEKKYNRYSEENYFMINGFGLCIVNLAKCYAPATLYDGIQFIRKGINIIYVHQLQNLYFALTGKELTILE